MMSDTTRVSALAVVAGHTKTRGDTPEDGQACFCFLGEQMDTIKYEGLTGLPVERWSEQGKRRGRSNCRVLC